MEFAWNPDAWSAVRLVSSKLHFAACPNKRGRENEGLFLNKASRALLGVCIFAVSQPAVTQMHTGNATLTEQRLYCPALLLPGMQLRAGIPRGRCG